MDTAYLYGEKQAYNVRFIKDDKGIVIDKQIIRFNNENNNDLWHAFEIADNTDQIKPKILKTLKVDGLITSPEYDKLIKNKWK